MTAPIKIGVSACLLGEHVRYDGGHRHDRYISDTLSRFFSFVPVCPEVECGMPTPREAMRLEGDQADPRLITINSRTDKTEQMLAYCAVKVKKLEDEHLCGFVFKERSPSCGLRMVPIYDGNGFERFTAGLFAKELVLRFPLMPLEEAERLRNPSIRNNFIECVFLHNREKNRQTYESCIEPLLHKADQ